jgi:NTP pyrophosphatase (non-canonical NTP hydrolase)
MSQITPVGDRSLEHRAAGNLAYLRSMIRSNEQLTTQEEENVEAIIKELQRGSFLKRFRAINVPRAREDFKTYDNAGILYMTSALAGEAGELGEIINMIAVQNLLNAKIGSLCNLIKKMERSKVGGPDHGFTTKMKDITPAKLRDEVGGIMAYLDLLCSLLDIDIEEATTECFNNVSNAIGSDYKL